MVLKPDDYDFGDASNYSFANDITCSNDETRKMYILAHGHMLNYNHEEAIACFQKCTELDPDCAMAWWGIAYCLSSNYNWSPGLGSGHDPIQQAMSLKDKCTELYKTFCKNLYENHTEIFNQIIYNIERVDYSTTCAYNSILYKYSKPIISNKSNKSAKSFLDMIEVRHPIIEIINEEININERI